MLAVKTANKACSLSLVCAKTANKTSVCISAELSLTVCVLRHRAPECQCAFVCVSDKHVLCC